MSQVFIEDKTKTAFCLLLCKPFEDFCHGCELIYEVQGDCVTHETPEETATRCKQDRESHRIRREQQSVLTKIVNFHSHLAALQVPPFVPLSQSHSMPSPTPACVEAFPLIRC